MRLKERKLSECHKIAIDYQTNLSRTCGNVWEMSSDAAKKTMESNHWCQPIIDVASQGEGQLISYPDLPCKTEWDLGTKLNEKLSWIGPPPYPQRQDHLKQFLTLGRGGVDLSRGLPWGMVTGKIEPCIIFKRMCAGYFNFSQKRKKDNTSFDRGHLKAKGRAATYKSLSHKRYWCIFISFHNWRKSIAHSKSVRGLGRVSKTWLDWKSKLLNWNVTKWKATQPSLRVFCGKLAKWETRKSCKIPYKPL